MSRRERDIVHQHGPAHLAFIDAWSRKQRQTVNICRMKAVEWNFRDQGMAESRHEEPPSAGFSIIMSFPPIQNASLSH